MSERPLTSGGKPRTRQKEIRTEKKKIEKKIKWKK